MLVPTTLYSRASVNLPQRLGSASMPYVASRPLGTKKDAIRRMRQSSDLPIRGTKGNGRDLRHCSWPREYKDWRLACPATCDMTGLNTAYGPSYFL